jgi:hypothetical protein
MNTEIKMSDAAVTHVFDMCDEIIKGITDHNLDLTKIREHARMIWIQGRIDMGRDLQAKFKERRPVKSEPTKRDLDLGA